MELTIKANILYCNKVFSWVSFPNRERKNLFKSHVTEIEAMTKKKQRTISKKVANIGNAPNATSDETAKTPKFTTLYTAKIIKNNILFVASFIACKSIDSFISYQTSPHTTKL